MGLTWRSTIPDAESTESGILLRPPKMDTRRPSTESKNGEFILDIHDIREVPKNKGDLVYFRLF